MLPTLFKAPSGSGITLDSLITEAEQYGRPHLMRHKCLSWSASISFNTKSGMELTAKADYNTHQTAQAAMAQALERAKEIIKQFKD